MNNSPTISTCLWFDNQAEEAAKFYTSIFKNSKIIKISYYGEAGHNIHGQKAGTVLTVDFELNGRRFQALNGGSHFKFNETISIVVICKNQDEIDYYWDKLSADPKSEQCGWLKDKYGLSWQIVPTVIEDLMSGPATEKSERMMNALFEMRKLDIAALKRAYDGK